MLVISRNYGKILYKYSLFVLLGLRLLFGITSLMLPPPDNPVNFDRSVYLGIFRGYRDADIPKLIGRMERGEVSIVLKYDILEFLNYFSGRIHLLIRDEKVTDIDPDIYSFFRILGDRYVLNNNLGAALYSARNITQNVIKILESRVISYSHE